MHVVHCKHTYSFISIEISALYVMVLGSCEDVKRLVKFCLIIIYVATFIKQYKA